MIDHPVCVLCGQPAITTAAQILVCDEHWQAYKAEASQYLPLVLRPVYQSLLQAERRARNGAE